jgi:hypothetical protein
VIDNYLVGLTSGCFQSRTEEGTLQTGAGGDAQIEYLYSRIQPKSITGWPYGQVLPLAIDAHATASGTQRG